MFPVRRVADATQSTARNTEREAAHFQRQAGQYRALAAAAASSQAQQPIRLPQPPVQGHYIGITGQLQGQSAWAFVPAAVPYQFRQPQPRVQGHYISITGQPQGQLAWTFVPDTIPQQRGVIRTQQRRPLANVAPYPNPAVRPSQHRQADVAAPQQQGQRAAGAALGPEPIRTRPIAPTDAQPTVPLPRPDHLQEPQNPQRTAAAALEPEPIRTRPLAPTDAQPTVHLLPGDYLQEPQNPLQDLMWGGLSREDWGQGSNNGYTIPLTHKLSLRPRYPLKIFKLASRAQAYAAEKYGPDYPVPLVHVSYRTEDILRPDEHSVTLERLTRIIKWGEIKKNPTSNRMEHSFSKLSYTQAPTQGASRSKRFDPVRNANEREKNRAKYALQKERRNQNPQP